MNSRKRCLNCGGENLHVFLDLGDQPNGNFFLTEEQLATEPVYPLSMATCSDCWQVQIDEFPSQNMLFEDHPYITGVNVPVVEHFKRMAGKVTADLGLVAGSTVIDIGCNDGSLLSCFRELGMATIGVDPSKRVVGLARNNGHPVCQCFWNKETGEAIASLGINPKLITATAVFYHLPDLHDFIKGLDAVMDDDTVFVVQGVNLLDLIQKLEFDHFYHEHSCIHSISALKNLFEQHDMRVFDVSFYDIHGGSFLAYVGKRNCRFPTSKSVDAAIEAEHTAGLDKLETYIDFAQRVKENGAKLRRMLEDLKAQGKTVYGLGAPLKGSTLLNYLDIGPDLVSCLTEVNSFKIGLLSPGTHIPVVDERKLETEPDYYLVLAWNFLDFFQEKKKDFLANGGKLIVPVPELRVIG